jgi:hypothetical protein
VKMTIHLQLLLRLRNHGSIHPLPYMLSCSSCLSAETHFSFTLHFIHVPHSLFPEIDCLISAERTPISMLEPSIGYSHRLPNRYRGNAYTNRYPSNSPINKISMVTNNRNKTRTVASSVFTWVRLKAVNETTRIGSVQLVSQLDDSVQFSSQVD